MSGMVMMANVTANTRGMTLRALLDLVACLPVDWDWRPLRGLRVLVLDSARSAMVVAFEGGAYVADVEVGAPDVVLAGFGRPGVAVEALERLSAGVAAAGFVVPGDGAA
jgi:hypothetical protein